MLVVSVVLTVLVVTVVVTDGRGTWLEGAMLIGLYGMIERTELAGGRLHIRTRPGRGVAIRAVL